VGVVVGGAEGHERSLMPNRRVRVVCQEASCRGCR